MPPDDLVHINDCRAVDLNKPTWVKLLNQLPHRASHD